MRFFTVDEGIKPWFRIAMDPYPRVFEGDWGGEGGGLFFCLPLGASLKRLLVGDLGIGVNLHHGRLQTTAGAGKVIVKQTIGEAVRDGLALILLTTQPGEGGHVWYSALRGSPIPTIVGSIPVGASGYHKHLLLFSKGQALVVEREGRFTGPPKFILQWDGRWLSSGGPAQYQHRPRPQPQAQ